MPGVRYGKGTLGFDIDWPVRISLLRILPALSESDLSSPQRYLECLGMLRPLSGRVKWQRPCSALMFARDPGVQACEVGQKLLIFSLVWKMILLKVSRRSLSPLG